MILGIQLLGILFGMIMIYFTFLYYKKNNYSKRSFLLWLFTWIGVIIIFGIPQLIYGIMNALAIQRTADFFTAAAIIFLTTLIFYLFNTVKQTESKMEKLVRKIAIQEEEKQIKRKQKK